MLTEEQFSYLAKKYMDTVFRLAFHYTKSRSESDDIAQEVLLTLNRAATASGGGARGGGRRGVGGQHAGGAAQALPRGQGV